MATACVAETCSITADVISGVLNLNARLAPDGGLECVGDGTDPGDGLAVHRLFDAENPPVPAATAEASSDCIIPIQVTDDGQVFAYIPTVKTLAYAAGVQRSLQIGESNPSIQYEYTNETNCPQLVEAHCSQPQITVVTLAGGSTPTNFEGFVSLKSNLANINGVTTVFQRLDKSWLSAAISNELTWYHLIKGTYIVDPGQTLEIELTVTVSALDNLGAQPANGHGFTAIGNYLIIHPNVEDLTP